MTKIVSVINLKGGVGKTTTTVQLAECLVSQHNMRVLVIDLDPQTNATIAMIGEDEWETLNEAKKTIYHLFLDKMNGKNEFDIKSSIFTNATNLNLPSLHLFASNINLIGIQDNLQKISDATSYSVNPMEVLKSVINNIKENYDYILIDCPPNLGFITQNGIEISDFYLIPTIPDKLSTYGIEQIISQIEKIRHNRTLKIKCIGLIWTKYYSSSRTHDQTLRNFPATFKRIFSNLNLPEAHIFKARIPQSDRTASAMDVDDTALSSNKPTFIKKYGSSSSGGQALYQYVISMTSEFIEYAN